MMPICARDDSYGSVMRIIGMSVCLRCRAGFGCLPRSRATFGRSAPSTRPNLARELSDCPKVAQQRCECPKVARALRRCPEVARQRPQCPNPARERGRRPNFARQGKRCPNLAREREHFPKALTQTRSQARAWQNIPVRAILFHSPYEAPRYVGARRAAIAHAIMRSDSAEGGPWRTTPYKKIACA